MPAKTRTLIPSDPDDLICATCPERYPYRGDAARTRASARVAGWHILEGPLGLTVQAVCPTCVGTPRSRIPAPAVLEGQVDVFEALGINPEHVQKERKSKKGRETS
jgi:hypothetical protein